MDGLSFDGLTRSLTDLSSRRGLLRGLAAALSLIALDPPHLAGARKKRQQKPVFNAFGCVNVDGKCRGNSSLCCSGICQGKKPKKGEKDKSRCVAHNTGGCSAALQSCGPVPDVPCGAGGFCLATTGNAGFCGAIVQATCATCQRDTDCQGIFGAGAACVICANGSCPATGDRLCVAAGA
jgi:hypothetical protein